MPYLLTGFSSPSLCADILSRLALDCSVALSALALAQAAFRIFWQLCGRPGRTQRKGSAIGMCFVAEGCWCLPRSPASQAESDSGRRSLSQDPQRGLLRRKLCRKHIPSPDSTGHAARLPRPPSSGGFGKRREDPFSKCQAKAGLHVIL